MIDFYAIGFNFICKISSVTAGNSGMGTIEAPMNFISRQRLIKSELDCF